MKKIKNPELLFKVVCCLILILLGVYIANAGADAIASGGVVTPTIVPTSTATPSPTLVPTNTPTPTATSTPTVTPTNIPSPTSTPTATCTPTSTPTPTLTPTPTIHPLYENYSAEELELLFRVVEAEATSGDVECKSHVASVIFNRLKTGWWGDTLTEVMMAKYQFEVVTNGRYLKMKIVESTIKACELAFEQDTTQGALFFDSTNGNSWAARNARFLFRDKIGHDFYAVN